MLETAIIDSVFKVMDKFVELLKYKHEKKKDLFENILEPLFNDLMVMHTDYIQMFEQCWSQLLDNKVPLQEIAEALRQRRIVYEGLRIKSRAIADSLKKSNLPQEVTEFLVAAAYHIPDGELGPVQSTPASLVLGKIYSAESLVEAPHKSENSPMGVRREVLNLVIATTKQIRNHLAWICETYVRAKIWALK